jgi:hypothetical protein
MSSKPTTFKGSSPTPSQVESIPAPSQPERSFLDRFPPWVSTNIRSKQSRKLLLRCWLASWAAFVIMLPNTTLRTMGNACVPLSPILRADCLYHLVSWDDDSCFEHLATARLRAHVSSCHLPFCFQGVQRLKKSLISHSQGFLCFHDLLLPAADVPGPVLLLRR